MKEHPLRILNLSFFGKEWIVLRNFVAAFSHVVMGPVVFRNDHKQLVSHQLRKTLDVKTGSTTIQPPVVGIGSKFFQ